MDGINIEQKAAAMSLSHTGHTICGKNGFSNGEARFTPHRPSFSIGLTAFLLDFLMCPHDSLTTRTEGDCKHSCVRHNICDTFKNILTS
jgi:hypothetical protein